MPTYKNNTDQHVSIVSTEGKLVWLAPGDEEMSFKVYAISGLDKISDEPYYQIAGETHIEEFTEAGTAEIVVDMAYPLLEIRTDVDAEIRVNTATGNKYVIPAKDVRILTNEQTIESLHVTVAEAGTVTVIEITG